MTIGDNEWARTKGDLPVAPVLLAAVNQFQRHGSPDTLEISCIEMRLTTRSAIYFTLVSVIDMGLFPNQTEYSLNGLRWFPSWKWWAESPELPMLWKDMLGFA